MRLHNEWVARLSVGALAEYAQASAIIGPLTITVSEAKLVSFMTRTDLSEKAKNGKVESTFSGMKAIAAEFKLEGEMPDLLQPVLRKAASDCVLG